MFNNWFIALMSTQILYFQIFIAVSINTWSLSNLQIACVLLLRNQLLIPCTTVFQKHVNDHGALIIIARSKDWLTRFYICIYLGQILHLPIDPSMNVYFYLYHAL